MTTLTAPAPDRRITWLLKDTAALTGRSLRHELRNVDGLIMSIVLPVMLLLLFVYVFGGAMRTGGDYLDYVVPGIIVLTAAFGAGLTATSVAQDLTTGTIDRLRAMPTSPAALLAGHVTATMLRTMLSTVVVIALAVAIGFRPTTSPLAWLGVAGVVAMAVTAVGWIAVAFGVLARSVEGAGGFTFFVAFLPYVSSAFVPPETLPAALRPIAEHQFVTPIIETMRGLLLDQPIGDAAWLATAWCVGIVALAIPASALLFRRRTRR